MTFTIPLPPVTKKNHGQIIMAGGKPRLLPSPQYRAYEQDASLFVPAERIEGPVEVTALFYMPTHRMVDLTNLLEALDDLLVSCGLLPDDCSEIIVSHDGSRVRYDKNHPRTEVRISPFHETTLFPT